MTNVNLSWNSVQNLRDEKKVKVSNSNIYNLHNLVPLYFTYDTPSNYRMWQQNKDIALFCINKKIVYSPGFSFAFTDGNAANGKTNMYNNLDNLEQLDWSVIDEEKPNLHIREIKRKRMAEFLVYPKINTRFIDKIIVPTSTLKYRVEKILRQLLLDIQVIENRNYFW